MASLAECYHPMIAALADYYGQPLPIAKERSAYESMLAAALSRSVDSARARSILEKLDHAGILVPAVLSRIESAEILDSLRDSGESLPPRSAIMLSRLAQWYIKAFGDDNLYLDLASREASHLRAELAAINGIGLATADAILLAMKRPVYPVDRGSYRILVRHGWIDSTADYDHASELLSGQASGNCEEIARLAVWLLQVGRQFCRARSPRCQHCPLRCVLPDQGPLEPDG
jgi:endonuclease III